jgi:hypothetical protein
VLFQYLQGILCRAHITLRRARSTSQAADNVTVTWRICTTESKVRARRESQGDGATFEAAWVAARNARECLYHGGVWRRESLGGREGGSQEIQDSAGWAPWPQRQSGKEKYCYLTSVFEMKGSDLNRMLCQGFYDRGASSSFRPKPISVAQAIQFVTKFAHR